MEVSDHFFITFNVNCALLKSEYRSVTYRNYKTIDMEKFKNDVKVSLDSSKHTNFGEKITFYNDKLNEILNKYAPLKTKSVKIVPKAPWFDHEYRTLRKKRRKAEKKYLRTKKPSDKKLYCDLRKDTTELASAKKHQYFSKQISDCPSTKALYACVNRLLDNTKSDALPSRDSPKQLADEFNNFFKKKIQDIRNAFSSTSSDYQGKKFSGEYLEVFRPATLDEVEAIVSKFGLKCSPEDPLPRNLLNVLTDILLPIWLELVNLSLEQGSIDCLKSAVVIPLLKGLDSLLDTEIFKNYRPVSNLQLIGKIIERIVGMRLDEHMDVNNLHSNNQYGYKRYHSTETLLLKIANDLLLACDLKIPTLLMCLDLSAAFDTVDQLKMLLILEISFGVRGTALKWFKSFLMGRTQRVLIEGELSDPQNLDYGVAQGSILGPKLFNIYAQSFASSMKSNIQVNVEGYADDHQVQKKFNLIFQFSFLSEGINNIYNTAEKWMLEYFLKINCGKTLLMIVAPPSVLTNIHIKGTFINGCCIRFVSEAKNLGVILDSVLSFSSQIRKVVKACYKTLRNISRIKRFLTKDQLQLLACALVFSQIDYCNALYYMLNADLLAMLQSVQNSAARLVCKVNRFDNISSDSLFKDLHWLKVNQRIEYKIVCIVYKCLNGLAPADLSSALVLSKSSRTLMLNIPSFHSRYGERSFSVSGPRLWNMLPYEIRSSNTLFDFKKKVKTYLFRKCFNLV